MSGNSTDAKDAAWQRAVTQNAGFLCAGCDTDYSDDCRFDEETGKKNLFVCGHHKKSKKAHPTLRYDIENGVCLCKDCHTKIHALGQMAFDVAMKVIGKQAKKLRDASGRAQIALQKGVKSAKADKPKKKFEKIWGATSPPARMKKSTDGKKKKVKIEKAKIQPMTSMYYRPKKIT